MGSAANGGGGFPDPLGRGLRYERLSDIAAGSFGFVQRCIDKVTGEEVAAKFILRKVLSTNAKLLKSVEREIVNHSRLVHPFIISFKDFFLLEQYLVIVQELADQGDLADYIFKHGALAEEQARRLFQQFIIALDYMHSSGIVNRDVKPENTLVKVDADGELSVRICDFGNSKDQERQSQAKTRVGSPQYMAPEVVTSPESYDGKMADMWSCGVMLYVMLMARNPFLRAGENVNHSRMFARMRSRAYMLKESLSPEVKDLIRSLLQPEVGDRISLAKVLEHPWFVQDMSPELLKLTEGPQEAGQPYPPRHDVLNTIIGGVVDPPLDPIHERQANPAPSVPTNTGSILSAEDVQPSVPKDRKSNANGDHGKGCCLIC